MGLELGNLIGAASSIQAGFGKENSLKKFMSAMDSLGVQITSRYEAVFSALPQSSFFITQISSPGVKQNVTNLYFDGKLVEIPQNFEYEHDFSMTVINDASGYIYTALTNFLVNDSGSAITNSGYTITIKAIGDDKHKGTIIKLNGVRLKSCSGLSFQHSGGDVQTFTMNCSAIDFSVTPGQLGKVSGVVGALGSIFS